MTPKITLSSRAVTLAFGAPAAPPPVAAGGDALSILKLEAPVAAGWAGHYRVETHDKTDEEIVAEINRVQIHHEKKSGRLDGFKSLIGSTFSVGGSEYTIAHVSIGEQGTDVSFYAAAVSESGMRTVVQGVYPTVDQVPTDAEIVQLLQGRIVSERAEAIAETAKMARLNALLGGG